MKMKIKLQGIGIIKDSEIELDGLTVITGDNSSGKTTVGKVVYSLFDAVSNLQEKFENDKNTYATRALNAITRDLDFLSPYFENSTSIDSDLSGLFSHRIVRSSKAARIAKKLYDWLKEFREIGFEVIDDKIRDDIFKEIEFRFRRIKNTEITAEDYIDFLLDSSLESLIKLFESLENDPQLIDYARENIFQTLNVEFSGQIQPVKFDMDKSSITVEENNKISFEFNIENNKIVNKDNEPIYFVSLINSVFFVDNPFVLDEEELIRVIDFGENNDTFLNKRRILHHEFKLRNFLKSQNDNNIFETTILEKKHSEINAKISEVISGEFEFSHDGDYYVKKGRKLRFSNLATGSKLFSILKLLINKGALNESSILILDEPEAHLHPAWQNKFAEIIVMLVKELNVKVLLTSHSPNFVLAIDAFMRKYEINDKTNFYQTQRLEDGFATYEKVNNNMGKIYEDFVQYLTEVKLLRNRYMHGLGENND